MDWYKLTKEAVEKKLQVDVHNGLTKKEVSKRKNRDGLNTITLSEKTPGWIIFIKQFQDFMVLILLAATLIAGLLGEYIDALAIIVIVLLNGIIGYFQEQKAEKSLEKLKELSAPKIKVLREGEWLHLPSEDAVIGDIVKLSAGDRIPADLRLITANSLEIEESTLTGESLPVSKITDAIMVDNLPLQDRTNIAYKSTLVTKGSGIGVVIQTGMHTEIGKIATLMDRTKKVATPLELKLVQLGKVLIYVVLLLTALTVFIGIYHGQPIYDMFLAGVSLAVAVIPEGLPAIVTVALSLGVQRMIKRKAIVRKLSAVETLGSASVICTDKTGTLTENNMTVQQCYVAGDIVHIIDDTRKNRADFFIDHKKVTDQHARLQQLLLYGALCNEATIHMKKGQLVVDGDPTDGALLVAERKFSNSIDRKAAYRTDEIIPFDSTRKRMTAIVSDENGRKILIVKGAPEYILPRCSTFATNLASRQAIYRKDIDEQLQQMASNGLRVIALGFRFLSQGESSETHLLENNLNFLGLFGLKDPPRKEVKQAIKECIDAGIKTVMITGDHKQTAMAIGKEIGLYKEGDYVLEGVQLNEISEQQLASMIEKVSIFARVTPEHKLKIVQAFQQCGHVVAMTGDGVNDAPAIKASNIGISMGISGTDVTKEASDLILLDDNFNTIKEAIREGRNIYENIRKFIRYLLASNVGEIFVMLVAMLLAMPLPLVPVQILWVNLITDGLPAMALGVDPPEKNVMKQKPRNLREGIFSRGLGFKIVSRGILIGIVTLIAFAIAYAQNPDNLTYAQSIAFTTLVLAQLIHVFDCRSDRGVFSRSPFSNWYLILAVLSSFILLLIVIYVEALQPIFHTTALHITDWLLIIVLSALPTVLFSFSTKRQVE